MFNYKFLIEAQISKFSKRKYDLEERTAVFGENIIRFCLQLTTNAVSRPIIEQVIRSGTGIGANYAEANGASSKRDFRNKIAITKRECKETMHWIRMLTVCCPKEKEQLLVLFDEARQLTLIFSTIHLNSK